MNQPCEHSRNKSILPNKTAIPSGKLRRTKAIGFMLSREENVTPKR